MKFEKTQIEGLIRILPEPFEDQRGVFRRHYCRDEYEAAGLNSTILQTNISENFHAHTLRGFHFQHEPHQEDKTFAVLSGAIFNVIIDLRKQSKTFLQFQCFEISSTTRESLFVPKGCANAFLTLSDNTMVLYYMTETYQPSSAGGIRYNDPYFNIPWPHDPKVIAERDASFPDFDPRTL